MAEITLTLNDDIKREFLEQANKEKLTPAQYLEILLRKVSILKKDGEPNAETKKAMEELEQGLGHRFSADTIDDVMREMEKIINE